MLVDMDIDSGGIDRIIVRTQRAAGDFRQPLGLFLNYMRTQTVQTFQALARGGTYRGVTWAYASDYTIGRKRPSGRIFRDGDAILQDTRRLLRSVTSTIDYQETNPTYITWGTRLHYAAEQHARRPFLFFTNADAEYLERLILRHLEGRNGTP